MLNSVCSLETVRSVQSTRNRYVVVGVVGFVGLQIKWTVHKCCTMPPIWKYMHIHCLFVCVCAFSFNFDYFYGLIADHYSIGWFTIFMVVIVFSCSLKLDGDRLWPFTVGKGFIIFFNQLVSCSLYLSLSLLQHLAMRHCQCHCWKDALRTIKPTDKLQWK